MKISNLSGIHSWVKQCSCVNFIYPAVDRLNTGFLFLFFLCVCPVNTTLLVQMGAKALLCCPAIPETKAVLITWVIALRGQPPCIISYRVDTKEINETNCMDRRITWVSTSDQSPELQINAVALDHDGFHSCEIVTPKGNFQERHDLQVLGKWHGHISWYFGSPDFR